MFHGRQRKISTFHADSGKGYAEVWMDFKEEVAFIKYFDDNDVKFFEEDFPNKTISLLDYLGWFDIVVLVGKFYTKINCFGRIGKLILKYRIPQ